MIPNTNVVLNVAEKSCSHSLFIFCSVKELAARLENLRLSVTSSYPEFPVPNSQFLLPQPLPGPCGHPPRPE